MRRAWGSLCFVLFALHGMGQDLLLPRDARVDLGNDLRNIISLQGVFDYNANTVFNELPLAILQGGYLEREPRQRSSDRLKQTDNTAGYVFQSRLQWTGVLWRSMSHWRPLIGVAWHEQSGLSFTADQFDVAFFGNAAFQERTAKLSPSGYEQVGYQTIGAGMMNDSTGSFVRIDLVRGRSFAALDVRSAELFTGADGRVLRTSLTGDYFANDTANGGGFDRTNGLGAALSGRWTHETKGRRPVRFGAGVDDLGFITWNPNSVRIRKDTLFSYEGWRVENLFALDNVFVNEEAVLDTFGLHYQRGSVTRLTPFHAYADVSISLTDRWRIGLAVDHRHLPGYIPQVTAQGSRVLGERTMLGASVSYGGFGAVRFGLAVKRRFGKNVLLSLSTPQVPGLVSTRASGLGLLFGLGVGF